jgi:hypothetical protein
VNSDSRSRQPSPLLRVVAHTAQVLTAGALCAFFFGICVPFFLVATVPSLPYRGLAALVYVYSGGLLGLLFGALSSAVSLRRTERWTTRYVVALELGVSALIFAYGIAYLNIPALQNV